MVVGGIIGLIVIAGGTMAYLVSQHNAEVAQQRAAAQAQLEAQKKAAAEQQAALERKFAQQQKELNEQLAKATNDADRARIRAQMAAASDAHHKSNGKDSAKKSGSPKVGGGKSNDPLGGLDL
jgi:uncharacterized protein HemX